MFNKYADLILFVAIAVEIIQIYFIIKLLRKNNKLETINKKLREEIGIFNKGNGTARSTSSRIFMAMQLNAQDIASLKGQMNHVNKWLGDVLNISNLMHNEENKEVTNIIEELRQSVEWAKEIEKQKVDEQNYYKGD